MMIKTNHYLIKSGIKSGALTKAQKDYIVNQLLSARSDERDITGFKKSVKAPEYLNSIGQSSDERILYPLFYIPPYNNNKKLQTVLPMSPKTHILAANSYELEIIRLLYMLAPDNTIVNDMVAKTLSRLKTTCFGYHDCHVGECFHAALITLRFISTVTNDIEWIKKLVTYFNKYNGETYRHGNTVWYYWLCLSEMQSEIALPEIQKYKNEFINRLSNKSCVMNNENNQVHNPVLYCVLRNCLSRLPEYAYIKDRQPYVNEKDGRLYFDMRSESMIKV